MRPRLIMKMKNFLDDIIFTQDPLSGPTLGSVPRYERLHLTQ